MKKITNRAVSVLLIAALVIVGMTVYVQSGPSPSRCQAFTAHRPPSLVRTQRHSAAGTLSRFPEAKAQRSTQSRSLASGAPRL